MLDFFRRLLGIKKKISTRYGQHPKKIRSTQRNSTIKKW